MSIPEQIVALQKLAEVDRELKIVDSLLTQENGTLDGITAGLKQVQDALKIERDQIAAIEKTKSELMIDLRAMMQQLDHSRDKLNRSRNERESNAAQRESEELKRLVRDREEEIERANNELVAKRIQSEAKEAEEKRLTEELAANEAAIRAKVAEGTTQKTDLTRKRDQYIKVIPPQLFSRYENVRKKKGSAVSETTTGICKACNMALPPQLFNRLRREPLIEQCPSCYRIIYFVPPPSEGESEA